MENNITVYDNVKKLVKKVLVDLRMQYNIYIGKIFFSLLMKVINLAAKTKSTKNKTMKYNMDHDT